ncbi:hypothetical protein [Aggregatibacter actinomycetemcomitans]|uniref:hypothetical protein n=1 Tax=Aggregatibacter actinomycetemcomitans TaxID=714 RepID=UPI00197BEA21|nr:hypothetical protein [Aggregatibacter actinomycetemcomitans]MBN6058658.1 hypothetical protein [Aggregatibacter actinomycetemcomitans]MBN6087167.1 hypothetical protein [Aggregatibacter actinomycetemcomitans]
MTDKHKNRLKNRAKCDSVENGNSKCCDEPLIFALKDDHHEFSIGLSTILECLKFAQDEGVIPPIPVDWWFDIATILKIPSNRI